MQGVVLAAWPFKKFQMSHWETQLRKGLVELAVLATIARGETYGYRIVEQLQGLDGLQFTESTIYPVLTRLRASNCWQLALSPRRPARCGGTIGSPPGENSARSDGAELEERRHFPFRIAQL